MKLKDIKLCTATSNLTVQEAKYRGKYIFVSSVDLNELVEIYTAVVGKKGQLINKSDYLSFQMDK